MKWVVNIIFYILQVGENCKHKVLLMQLDNLGTKY